jgi:hypothetical protein
MHVPIGVSGVHAVPNTLHSHGLITPLSTSPHWQAFGSAVDTAADPTTPVTPTPISPEVVVATPSFTG